MYHLSDMNDQKQRTPLAAFVIERRKALGWTQTRLSKAAELGGGTLSNLENDKSTPEVETVLKVGDALGAPRETMLALLTESFPDLVVPEPEIDREAANLAKRVSALPDGLRERVMDALSAVFDNMVTAVENAGQEDVEAAFQRLLQEHADDTEVGRRLRSAVYEEWAKVDYEGYSRYVKIHSTEHQAKNQDSQQPVAAATSHDAGP